MIRHIRTSELIRRQRGATLVEFAMASVLFFTVLFGIIDFGQSVWRYNMMADLAQEGARWASVRGATSNAPASSADVQTYVRSRSSAVVTVSTTRVNASHQCTETSVNPSALNSGEGVCVSVRGSYGRSSAIIPIPSVNLRGQAQMIIAR